ncbi:MAG TPA: serine hydrolase domain-containing protein [Streptosporangiaceae bacterium]|nr:serine hydrolase domain-containing protein [Streptosporangiaceae bacterium]
MTPPDLTTVHGACQTQFDLVRKEFERNFAERGEVGAAVTVVVDGETVVDLWGGTADAGSGRPWVRDTVVVVWSATKGATALCAHILAGRGELDLDAPVGKYWPEFACNGKETISTRMLLSHQAGLPAIRRELPAGAFYDWELMTTALAAESPFWTPGLQHGYHGLTFGFLVGEVVRRVSGMTLGTFFAHEVAGTLGLDFHIGLPEADEARVAPVIPQVPDPQNLSAMEQAAFNDPTSIPFLMLANSGGYMTPGESDSRAAHAAELPSTGGVTNARGLAGMYRPLAHGGAPLVSEGTVRRMAAVESASVDATILLPTRWALGYVKAVDNRRIGPNQSVIYAEEAFGHPGIGGSIGFADPRARMSFGYTMNKHGSGAGLNHRGQSLIDAAYRSLGYQTDASGTWA